ncbi:lysozyme inhibitor LprI family protein [Novosphingobium sp. 9U]|uniref:lysozyme inhibitor LprI family protein n=1 Tax=Novosphingobium sp. 9U TaxID=2653158 RepID=UPI0012F273B3|nr:hypothetical protein [Novosphingobium sp. 9U]VWX51298.1 conserved exported hypothetical protein [Novosphingobium sp. 9U]
MLKFGAAAALLVSAVLSPTHATAAAPQQPSFACTAARTQVEQAICEDADLAAADRKMAELFALAKTSAFGRGPSNQLPAQREALRTIRACGTAGKSIPLKRCIAAAYATRNAELAVAVLVASPDTALPVLRQLDPGAAPLLEATALWAAEPVDADWSAATRRGARATITRLLRPYMAAMQNDENQSFGRSILTEPGADGVAVRSVDDLFVSDRHFANFLNVLGPYLPELDAGSLLTNDRRTLPCAAIVRHPALLQATGPVFGSTMDNFVLDADCEQTLPPTPALTALSDKLLKAWPECDGTIRFAAYRGFETSMQMARLGRVEGSNRKSVPKRTGVSAAEIEAARVELAAYYRSYLGQSVSTAQALARSAIAMILDDAHECGG